MKIQVHTCINRNRMDSSSENLLHIVANMNIIENRQNAKSTQFVIKFGNFVSDIYLNCPVLSPD